jgi:hypothetical protein
MGAAKANGFSGEFDVRCNGALAWIEHVEAGDLDAFIVASLTRP